MARARSEGLTRMLGIMQDFGTSNWYKLPEPSHTEGMFDQWCAEGVEGIYVYSLSKIGAIIESDALSNADKAQVYQEFNNCQE
jgi:hypothetical protein